MNPKKVLAIDWLLYHLPDDFEGTLSDALRDLATYLEQPKDKIEQPEYAWADESGPEHAELLEVVKNGRRIVGQIGLNAWVDPSEDEDGDGGYEQMPLKTGGGR